jgi:hypothetical protein
VEKTKSPIDNKNLEEVKEVPEDNYYADIAA